MPPTIFELISSLLDPNIILEKYKGFQKIKSEKENFYNLDQNLSVNEMKSRIKRNLHIILSIGYDNYTYRTLFINYTNIVSNFYTISINNHTDEIFQDIMKSFDRIIEDISKLSINIQKFKDEANDQVEREN